LCHRVPAENAIPPATLRAKPQARRARDYRKRAAKLADEAQRTRDAEGRRHLLDLVECYKRTAEPSVARRAAGA